MLYGVDAGNVRGDPSPRLLAVAADTGAVIAEQALPADVWSIAWASVPEDLLPQGELQPAACTRPEPPLPALP